MDKAEEKHLESIKCTLKHSNEKTIGITTMGECKSVVNHVESSDFPGNV